MGYDMRLDSVYEVFSDAMALLLDPHTLAQEIADRKKDEVHLVGLIRVPRTMPIATPLPEAEAMVRRILDDAERAAKHWKVKIVRHVERVRTVTDGAHHVLDMLRPQMLVICIGKLDEEAHELMSHVMPSLLSEPPCEIIYDRRPA